MTTFFLTPRRVDISLLDAGHGGIKEKFIDNIPPPGESGLLFGHLFLVFFILSWWGIIFKGCLVLK